MTTFFCAPARRPSMLFRCNTNRKLVFENDASLSLGVKRRTFDPRHRSAGVNRPLMSGLFVTEMPVLWCVGSAVLGSFQLIRDEIFNRIEIGKKRVPPTAFHFIENG